MFPVRYGLIFVIVLRWIVGFSDDTALSRIRQAETPATHISSGAAVYIMEGPH
jgi:hypothetical protein